MTVHRILSLNCEFAGFSNSRPLTDLRVRQLANVIRDSGADLLGLNEVDRAAATRIVGTASKRWRYNRAAGSAPSFPGAGLNAVAQDMLRWRMREDRSLWDWRLNSYGQSTRTAILVPLADEADDFVWVGATHLAPKGAPLNTQDAADRAKLAQTHQLIKLIGDRRAIVALDLPRTNDDACLAALAAAGWRVHGRTQATPQVVISHGAVTVLGAETIDTGTASNHDAVLTSFLLPTAAAKQRERKA